MSLILTRTMAIKFSAILIFLFLSPSSALCQVGVGDNLYDQILNSVRDAVSSGDTSETKERALHTINLTSKYLKRIHKFTEYNPLVTPISFAGLTMIDARFRGFNGDSKTDSLIIGTGGELVRISNSIVIADGDIDISYANDCLIIASGGVEISHSSRNIIIAGYYIDISHDNSKPHVLSKAKALKVRTVGISGNLLEISHAKDSIASAPGLVDIAHAKQVLLVNSPNIEISHGDKLEEVYFQSLKYPKKEFIKPIAEERMFIEHRDNGVYKAQVDSESSFSFKLGEEITKCCGAKTEVLAGWTPINVMDIGLVLRKKDSYALVFTKDKR